MKAGLVTHADLDGIISAAITARAIGLKGMVLNNCCIFSSVRRLRYSIKRIVEYAQLTSAENVFVSDLCPSEAILTDVSRMMSSLTDYGIRVVWIDHHEWSKKAVQELSKAGVELILRQYNSCAELVAEYWSLKDTFTRRLIQLAHDSDTGSYNNKLTLLIDRLLVWYQNPKIRYELLQSFAQGVLDTQRLLRLYERIKDSYETTLAKAIDRLRSSAQRYYVDDRNYIVVGEVIRGRILLSELKRALESEHSGAVLYVLVKPTEHRATLFSKELNVALIARRLGGGGHREVAGIPFEAHSIDKIVEYVKWLYTKRAVC